MKTNILKFGIILSVILTILSACSDDEYSTVGELELSFDKHSKDFRMYIFPMNSPKFIHEFEIKSADKRNITLNVGNYILKSNTNFNIGFQIKQDRTTRIMFDKYYHEVVK